MPRPLIPALLIKARQLELVCWDTEAPEQSNHAWCRHD